MARLKKVSDDLALQAAIKLFWEMGFFGLGTRQLEAETGITRFTLQTTYGGKKALFLSALDAYLDMFDAYVEASFEAISLEDLALWLEQRPVPEPMQDSVHQGCLMVNSILEFPRDDKDVTERAARFYDMMRRHFRQALTNIQSNQSGLAEDFDISQAVEMLLAAVIAQNVSNKTNATNADPKAMMQAAGAMVRGWRFLAT